MIQQYNKFMGGVDLADNMLANYRICIRGKKWWWPIFSNYIDVCMVNAWKLWLDVHPQEKVSLLQFRREVAVKFWTLQTLQVTPQATQVLLPWIIVDQEVQVYIFYNLFHATKDAVAGNATAKLVFFVLSAVFHFTNIAINRTTKKKTNIGALKKTIMLLLGVFSDL